MERIGLVERVKKESLMRDYVVLCPMCNKTVNGVIIWKHHGTCEERRKVCNLCKEDMKHDAVHHYHTYCRVCNHFVLQEKLNNHNESGCKKDNA